MSRHGALGDVAALALVGATLLLSAAPAAVAAPPAGRAHVLPTVGSPFEDVPDLPPTGLNSRLRACLPERLHPVSRQFLDLWLAGSIGTRTFQRFFHMPNSDYLPVGECLIRVRTRIVAEARLSPAV